MSDNGLTFTEPTERAREVIYGRNSVYETMTDFEINQFNTTAMNYGLIIDQNPYLAANTVALQDFASSVDPITAATDGAVMFAQQDINSMVNVWSDMDDATQRSTWSQLTDLQQRALLHAGVANPYSDKDKPWWQDALGVGADVVGFALGGVGTIAGAIPGGGKALDALIWIADQPFHLYRTVRQLDSWQQWVALGGTVAGVAAGVALAPFTGGSSLLAAGALAGSALAGAGISAAATNPTEFIDAWNASGDGERTFTLDAQRRARELLVGDELFALAKDVAYEMSPYDLATELAGVRNSDDPMTLMTSINRIADRMAVAGTPQHQTIAQGIVKLLETPEFMQAIQILENGKISIGRDVANTLGINPGSSLYNITSGSIDALSQFVLDPFLMVSPYFKTARFARYSMTEYRPNYFRFSTRGKPVTGITQDVVERRRALSNNKRAVRAMDEQIARAISNNSFRMMPKNMRALFDPIREYLQQTGVLDEAFNLRPGQTFEREDLLRWMTEIDQLQHIARGVGTVRGIQGVAVLKPMSDEGALGAVRKQFSDFRDNLVQPAALARLEKALEKAGLDQNVVIPASLDEALHPELVTTDLIDPVVVETLGGAIGRAVALVPGAGPTLGKFLDVVSNMAPRAGHIALEGPQAAEDIPRFVNAFGRAVNLPPHLRQQWIDAIMAQQGAAARIQLVMSFYDTLFNVTGLRSTRKGAQLADEFIHRWQQNYAIGSIDRMTLSTGKFLTSRGTLTIDNAVAMQVAEVRDLIIANRYANTVGKILGWADPDHLISMFSNRIWKPSVILRLGFIPRAAGEEALAMLARGTDGMLGAEFGARRLTQRKLYDAAVAKRQLGLPLNAQETKALSWELPALARPIQRLTTRLPVAGNIVESGLLTFEKFLRRVLDPKALDPNAGVKRRAIADAIDRRSPLVQALLTGREHSWRNVALRGVRRDLQDSAFAWYTRHGDTVMRSASSGSASIYNDYLNSDRVVAVEMDADGAIIETVQDRSSRQIVDQQHESYVGGIHEGAERVFADPVIGPALEDAYFMYVPSEFGVAVDDVAMLDDAVEAVDLATANIVLELLKFRRDRMLAFVQNAETLNVDPNIIALLRKTIDDNGVDNWDEIFDALLRYQPPMGSPTKQKAFIDRVRPIIDANLDNPDLLSWLHYRIGFVKRAPDKARLLREADYFGEFADFETTVLTFATQNANLPENFELVARSQRMLGGRNGDSRVVNPLSPNMRRLYSPDVNGTQRLAQDVQDLMDMGYTDPTQIADILAPQLLASYRNMGVNLNVSMEFLEEAVAKTLEVVIGEQLFGMPFTAIGGVSFGDPNIALFIGALLSDAPQVNARRVLHFKDVGRQTLVNPGDAFEGSYVHVSSNGGIYVNDEQARLGLQPVEGYTLPDGTFGVTQEELIEEFLQLGTQGVFNVHAKNVEVVYEPAPGTTVYEKKGDQFVPTSQKVFRDGDVYFDADGTPLQFRDNPAFVPASRMPANKQINWKLVGPMAADSVDFRTGSVARGRKTIKRQEQRLLRGGTREVMVYEDSLPLTWSRTDDVLQGDTASHAVARVYIPKDGTYWDRVMQFGFERVITPAIDALVRHPLGLHNFTMARTQNLKLLGAFVSPEVRVGMADAIPDTPEARKVLDDFVGSGYEGTDLEIIGAYHSYIRNELFEVAADQQGPLFAVLANMSRSEFNALVDPALRIGSDKTWLAFKDSFRKFDDWVNDVETKASIYAIANLEPFLDSSEFKSEFSQYTKNLLPFWYAEENFIKRWLRGAYLSGTFGLDQIRKGQLLYSGLQSTGVIQTDVNGTDWFIYPGSGILQNIVSRIVPFAGDLPVGTLFGATTNSLLPGFNAEAGRPGIGPFGAIPVNFLASLFPEFQELERSLLGDIGAGRGISGQLVPATVRRVWDAVARDENTSVRYGAAMNAAIAMMEAEGNGLRPDATAAETQEYLDRVRDHARIVLLTQAVAGFIVPGTPIALTTGEDEYTFNWLTGMGIEDPAKVFKRTYFFYLQTFGYEEGVRRYLSENPFTTIDDIVNPEAFQVARTEATTGKAIPTTEVAMQWYRDNREWVDGSPLASPWFAPIDEGVEDFSLYAYNEAFNNGLRRTVPPEEVLTSHLITRAASQYYYRKREFESRELQVASDPRRLANVRKEWDVWQTNFFAVNPVFKESLQTSDSSIRRQDTIRQTRIALDDPMTPVTAQTDGLREMIEGYDIHRGRLAELRLQGRSARVLELVRLEKKQFEAWAEDWVVRNPLIASYFSTVIQPELT